MIMVWYAVILWFLSILIGYLIMIATSLVTGENAMGYPTTIFSANLPAALGTFGLWFVYIPVIFKLTQKKGYMVRAQPAGAADTFLFTYIGLDFVLLGCFSIGRLWLTMDS